MTQINIKTKHSSESRDIGESVQRHLREKSLAYNSLVMVFSPTYQASNEANQFQMDFKHSQLFQQQ